MNEFSGTSEQTIYRSLNVNVPVYLCNNFTGEIAEEFVHVLMFFMPFKSLLFWGEGQMFKRWPFKSSCEKA